MERIHLGLIVKNQETIWPLQSPLSQMSQPEHYNPAEPDCNRTADNVADHNMHCYDLRAFRTEGRQERILLIKTNQSKYKIL